MRPWVFVCVCAKYIYFTKSQVKVSFIVHNMSLSVWYTIHTVMSKTLIHSYDMSCFEDDFGKKEKNDAERTRKAEIKKVELLA